MRLFSSKLDAKYKFTEEQNTSVKLLLKNATYRYFLENNISSEFMNVVESNVLLKFYENIDVIQKEYQGKSQFSTYCAVVMLRMVRSTVQNDLKLMEPAS